MQKSGEIRPQNATSVSGHAVGSYSIYTEADLIFHTEDGSTLSELYIVAVEQLEEWPM